MGVGAAVLLIILAIVLGCTLGKKSENYIHVEHFPLRWWQNSTIYRIYVTSFTDSDGDGFGDFKGSPNTDFKHLPHNMRHLALAMQLTPHF